MISPEQPGARSRTADHCVFPGAQVAHRLPGRIRLRFRPDAALQGWQLGAALVAHRDVVAVSWLATNRSLTVQHSPEVDFEQLVGSLPGKHAGHVPQNSGWEALVGLLTSFAVGLLGAGPMAEITVAAATRGRGRQGLT